MDLEGFIDGWLNDGEISIDVIFDSTYTMVAGALISFARARVEDPTLTDPDQAGDKITINFHSDDYRPYEDFTGLNGSSLTSAEHLTTIFGEGGFDVLTYDDAPINSDTIL